MKDRVEKCVETIEVFLKGGPGSGIKGHRTGDIIGTYIESQAPPSFENAKWPAMGVTAAKFKKVSEELKAKGYKETISTFRTGPRGRATEHIFTCGSKRHIFHQSGTRYIRSLKTRAEF